MAQKDLALGRIERGALVWCGLLALGALAWRRGSPDVAIGVLGGGALVGASYWAIKASVTRLTGALAQRAATAEAGRRARPRLGFALALFVFRYALLGLLAYVMIARLRLHPVGLLLGASSLVAAAATEAVRAARA
jgi:hypothetical protein